MEIPQPLVYYVFSGDKISKSQSSFTRRQWEAESMVQGALETGNVIVILTVYGGNPDLVFSANFCSVHPISVAWWWAGNGIMGYVL